jgi:hypothetical protein
LKPKGTVEPLGSLRYAAWALVKIIGAETPTPRIALVFRKLRFELSILLIIVTSPPSYFRHGTRVFDPYVHRINAFKPGKNH